MENGTGRLFALFFLTAALVFAFVQDVLAVGPPVRSTRFNGTNNAYSVFAHQPQFDNSVQMTIEAWVYREDSNRCETIVGHDYINSWWLGFCNRLRFYRSGGTAATSAYLIPAWQWTHVAATYDGTHVRFYTNGNLTDTIPLSNAGSGFNRPLVIGANPSGASFNYPFLGQIDEVRIWNTVRTQPEIFQNRYKEIRSAPGLVAAFGTGSKTENVASLVGTNGSGAAERVMGILPRDLVVPKAAIRPTVDGRIYLDSEYLGAEQLVMPYNAGPNEPDGIAWLVYTDTFPEKLYIAFSTPRHNVGGWPYSNTTFGVLLDPTYSRNPVPQPSDSYLFTNLGNLNPTGTWWNGNGSWFSQCYDGSTGAPCVPASEYQVGKFNCGHEFDYVPCIEFAINKSQLGSWSEFDGLALVHQGWNSLGVFSMAPGDASIDFPDTWAKVSYGDNTTSLPTATISGRVHAGLTTASGGLANWFVSMNAGGVNLSTYTDANGYFSFSTPVPPDAEINVYASNCGFCMYGTPTFTGPGINGTVVNNLQVRFPSCTGSVCTYKNVNFFVRQTPGPISLSGISVPKPAPQLVVRDNPKLVKPDSPSQVTIYGANLHEQVKVSLSPVDPALVCPCPNDWVLYDCPVVSVAGDGSSITVQMPEIQRRTKLRPYGGTVDSYQFGWRFVVEDLWTRPNMVTYNMYPAANANPKSFSLGEPEYPDLWGFGFINKDVSPGWREFSAVYGNNAYYCVAWNLSGDCVARVMDPVYQVFYPIYWLVGKAMTGSCAGMASTSLMFKHHLLDTESFDPNVHYPAGFRQDDMNYEGSWSRSELAVLTWPASPQNVWARIRVGQMSQITNEFLFNLIGQSCLEWEWSPFCGHADQTFNAVSNAPTSYVAAMVDSITGAHAITPYAVTPNAVKVYDNNYPYNKSVQIDVSGNSYTYTPLGYSGSGFFYFPLSIWTGSKTAPIFGTLDFLYKVVAGNANSMVTTQDGKRWGWLADGNFINEIPGSVTATPASGPYDGASVPLLLPANKPNATINVNATGGDYYVHTGQDGVMMQLHAFDAQNGDTDEVRLQHGLQNKLEGFRFKPQRTAANFVPAIGMKLGEDSALFRWVGLQSPAGQSTEYRGVKGQAAVQFTNLTTQFTGGRLLVNAVDAGTGQASQALFGPILVPAGASQKSTILNWPQNTQIRSDVDLDRNGTIDQTTTLQGVVPVSLNSVGQAKALSDGSLISLNRVVATSGQATFSGYIYCQDPGQPTGGIKVVASAAQLPSVIAGTMLQVIGTLSTDLKGERQIINPILLISHDEDAPNPVTMRCDALGGGTLGTPPAGQVGVFGGAGANNIGLLVRLTGRVLDFDATGAMISDGSATVRVDITKLPFLNFEVGDHITVTGISSLHMENGQRKACLFLRSAADVKLLWD